MSRPSDRDRILEALLAGDLDESDPQAQLLFGADPTAQAAFEELSALEAELLREGDAVRADVEAARALREAPGEARVHSILREQSTAAPEAAPPARRTGARGWLPLLAAAAVLALAWVVFDRGAAPEGELPAADELLMGPTELTLRSPVGAVESYPPFEWSADPHAGGWFELWVYDADSAAADPLLESGTLLRSPWSPTESTTAWPQRIRWTVSAYDASGNLVESRSAQASLRR